MIRIEISAAAYTALAGEDHKDDFIAFFNTGGMPESSRPAYWGSTPVASRRGRGRGPLRRRRPAL